MGSLAPELSYGAGSLTAVLLTAGEQFALGAVGDLTGQAVARMLGGRLSFSDLDYGSAVGVGIATMLGSPEGADALLPFGLEGTALQSFGSILGTIAGRITVSGLSPAVGLSAPPSAPGGLGGGPGGPTGAGPAPGGSEGSDASISGGANGNGAVGDGDPASDAYLEEIQGGTNSLNVGF